MSFGDQLMKIVVKVQDAVALAQRFRGLFEVRGRRPCRPQLAL